jgi:hypothetical protein
MSVCALLLLDSLLVPLAMFGVVALLALFAQQVCGHYGCPSTCLPRQPCMGYARVPGH